MTRIVPNLRVADVQAANALYADLFDLETRMDLGWVGNLGPREHAQVQLQTLADEEWGVRRFFFRDHDGNVVNVVANR